MMDGQGMEWEDKWGKGREREFWEGTQRDTTEIKRHLRSNMNT